MSLRLDLVVRSYPKLNIGEGEDPDMTWARTDRWTWRLWSGSRIVSSSGDQRFSHRIDACVGAEVGTGTVQVVNLVRGHQAPGLVGFAYRGDDLVAVRILDERTP